jgi:hypothetical protein
VAVEDNWVQHRRGRPRGCYSVTSVGWSRKIGDHMRLDHNRLLIKEANGKPAAGLGGRERRLERTANTNSLVGKVVHRYVAGPALEDGVAAAVQLNSQGIRGILDLLGEAVTDLSGASQATQHYLQALETIADRGIDATVSLKLTQLGLLIVGQQPFGGAGASGTNDKAGSVLNLLRWVSPRTIKETFVPATDYRYPFMR